MIVCYYDVAINSFFVWSCLLCDCLFFFSSLIYRFVYVELGHRTVHDRSTQATQAHSNV